ncbi:DUF6962 family protein [Microbulbifer okhotskensis]|uniref:DUF6962 family protein n=1 Tax=Microbulbifer okhotskensis TaxID=2926617 RepID=UPI00359C13AF
MLNSYVFSIYQFSISGVALVVYFVLSIRSVRLFPGGWFMVLGALACIVSMIIQLDGSLSVDIIWIFNHNSIYHFVQMIGLVCFILGLRKYFLRG